MQHDVQPVTSYQTVRLSRGKHSSPESGACVMELASMLAGEPFSDQPETASRVIGAFLRTYNDAVDDERRQDLYECAAKVVGTRAAGDVEWMRAERCRDTLSRLHATQPRLRRLLARRPRISGPEDAAVQLARALRRRGDAGHAAALRMVDELVAMSREDSRPGVSRPVASPRVRRIPTEA